MPQGRRKVPFSTKQKKLQLQAKREKKQQQNQQSHVQSKRRPFVSDDGDIEDELDDDQVGYVTGDNQTGNNTDNTDLASNSESNSFDLKLLLSKIQSINSQQNLSSKRDVNRYALQFFQETDQEIRQRKERARKPLPMIGNEQEMEKLLVCTMEDMFGASTKKSEEPKAQSEEKEEAELEEESQKEKTQKSSSSRSIPPQPNLDMPKRPPWNPTMSAEELHRQENEYFHKYLQDILSRSSNKLSYFEMNLETWRQLWRVIEMSDIILLVADIRHPIFHFPPSLYHYVVDQLAKDMILVLNKIDLVEPELVLAWKCYLQEHFPRLKILVFASYAGMKQRSSSGKRVGKLRMACRGALALQEMVAKIVANQVNVETWREKIETELKEAEQMSMEDDSSYYESDDEEDTGKRPKASGSGSCGIERLAETVVVDQADTSYYNQTTRFKDNIVTIGCVGHPNVGKSSLLNALYGKKVVSVSRTPGHTKHFQTIFLTETVRLCDCPGLVFPSRAPKELQVLMGCYPIAQLREPYTAVGYLAARVNLVRLLRLQHPDGDDTDGENVWSAYDICEAWAEKRSFLTARTARPDIYRAANNLLRMALDGRTICLAFQPPNYHKQKEFWNKHPEREMIDAIQNRKYVIDEQFNKNLRCRTGCGGGGASGTHHGQGYVDSHASSVEADVDEDEEDSSGGDVIATNSKFVLLEVDDAED